MPPVIVSPATKVPITLFKTTIPCLAIPPEVYEVALIAISPVESNNSKVFVVTFLTVKTVLSFTVTTVDVESTALKAGFENCICIPSLNVWPFEVTTLAVPVPGSVILVTTASLVDERD